MTYDGPYRVVSCDPGDKHVGWAIWVGGECISAIELNPTQAVTALETYIERHSIDAFVYEKFALYAWNERSMSGNEFLTSQLIGVFKYLCVRAGIPHYGQFASQHKRLYKGTAFKQLTPKELRLLPWWGNGGHAKDAWVIGEWWKRQESWRGHS